MSIPYSSGTLVNTTFTSDGTRSQLVTQLVAALTTAGWSTISGAGTTDIVMQTATTPQGFFLRLRFYDPGTGNCAQFFIKRSTDGTLSGANYLLPTSGRVYRIVAGPYWFYFYSTQSTDYRTARYYVAAHCPWVPSFVQSYLGAFPDLGLLQAIGTSDTSTSNGRWTWRSTIASPDAVGGGCTIHQNIINGVFTTDTSSYAVLVTPAAASNFNQSLLGFIDGTLPEQEAYVGWGMNSVGSNSGPMRLFGMLWDAFLIQGSVNGDSTITFDSKTWLAITHQADSRSVTQPPATLYVRIA